MLFTLSVGGLKMTLADEILCKDFGNHYRKIVIDTAVAFVCILTINDSTYRLQR